MNTHQQQIDKKLKNSRTMLNLSHHIASKSENVHLESLQLGALFLYSKNLIKRSSNTPSNNVCLSLLKSQVQHVLQFIVEKIENKAKLPIDKFVALISIFVYVNVMFQCQAFAIKYNQAFYKNLGFYVLNVFDAYANTAETCQKNGSKINLSILLCSLSSLVEENSKNIINIDTKKVFSPTLLKSLFSAKLPNEQKVMRHYKNLMVFVSKQQMPKFLKKMYIRSLGYHLMNCSVSKSMQISSIYLLNKFIEDNKLASKVGEIWNHEEMTKIVSTCLQIVLSATQFMQLKLVLEFCHKITSQLPLLEENIVDGEHFIRIYTQIYKNITNSDRLCPCLQQILMKISTESCSTIFKEISAEGVHSTVHLQILENCTKKINQNCVVEIISSGKWEKLLKQLQEISGSSYKKYLLNKIIMNIINNSQENEDLQFILKNLYSQSVSSYQFKAIN